MKTFAAHLLALFLFAVLIRGIAENNLLLTLLAALGLAIGMIAMGCKLLERCHRG